MNNILRTTSVFLRRKYRVLFKERLNKKDIELLKDTNFVIISDNCWGGAVYQWLGRPYNTPFVGVGFYGDCYIKLLSNFDYYMRQELKFVTTSKYPQRKIEHPLALLDDIEVHFRHYKTEEEAKTKWTRRTQRMLEETNKDNYYFKICSAWSASEQNYKAFHALKYKNKLSFHINDKSTVETPGHIKVIEREKNKKNEIVNGVKLFKLSFLYLDIFHWLRYKEITK